MSVHNHGIDPSCRESLIGDCLRSSSTSDLAASLEALRVDLETLANEHHDLKAFHKLSVDGMATNMRRQHATIDRVRGVASAIPLYPMNPLPEWMSLEERVIYTEGWDDALSAAVAFVKAALGEA